MTVDYARSEQPIQQDSQTGYVHNYDYDSVDPAAPSSLLEAELGYQSWSLTDIAVDNAYAIVSAGNYGAWATTYQQ